MLLILVTLEVFHVETFPLNEFASLNKPPMLVTLLVFQDVKSLFPTPDPRNILLIFVTADKLGASVAETVKLLC